MVKNFYLLQSELEMAKLKKTKILPGDKYDTFLIEKNMDMLDKVGEDYRQRVAQIKEEMKKELGVDHL
jgi:hypothetical protein